MLVYSFPHGVDHFLTRRVTRWSWVFSASLARTGAGVCLVHWCRAVSLGVGSESQMEWLPGDRYTPPQPPTPNRQVWEFLFGKDLEQAFQPPFSKPREGSCRTSMGYGVLIPAHARRRPGRRAGAVPGQPAALAGLPRSEGTGPSHGVIGAPGLRIRESTPASSPLSTDYSQGAAASPDLQGPDGPGCPVKPPVARAEAGLGGLRCERVAHPPAQSFPRN